jgi:hypothetical protein
VLWPAQGPGRGRQGPLPLSQRRPFRLLRTLFYLTSDIVYWIYDPHFEV